MKRVDNLLNETIQMPLTVQPVCWVFFSPQTDMRSWSGVAPVFSLQTRLCARSCTCLLPHLHSVDPAEPQLPIMDRRWCSLWWRHARAKGSELFWPSEKLFHFWMWRWDHTKAVRGEPPVSLVRREKGFRQVRRAGTGHHLTFFFAQRWNFFVKSRTFKLFIIIATNYKAVIVFKVTAETASNILIYVVNTQAGVIQQAGRHCLSASGSFAVLWHGSDIMIAYNYKYVYV